MDMTEEKITEEMGWCKREKKMREKERYSRGRTKKREEDQEEQEER